METIIIPTDFSASAASAMKYAIEMAMEIKASILVFHVYSIPVSVSDVPVVLVSAEELKKNAEEQLLQLKNEIEQSTSGNTKVYTEAVLGNTVDELEAVCKRVRPFTVVMGTRGSSGMERVLFGSTTLIAIRHVSSPIIIVPPGTKYTGIKKIGFACDFKKVLETTPTQSIKEIVKEFNAELYVLNVDHQSRHFKPDTPQESILLHTMLQDLNPEYHFIDDVDIEDGINRFAERNNIDLVITIPKKHTLLQGLFKKSSTRQLVFHSHVPIMCIHE
ncbi:MAG: universal stress protein [Bacteroidota bacterium]|nr:universal stress protein [Bacteroidota bacterium]